MTVYMDTSALVKLVVAEPETPALEAWVRPRADALFTSDLARTELARAVRRRADAAVRARAVLESMPVVALPARIFEAAGRLEPPELRSLDAIHLASALDQGDELEVVLTYDERMAAAAHTLGIPTASPGG